MTRRISVIYKILTALTILTGILLNLINTTSVVSLLSYYTSQSNIICLIAFAIYSVMEIKNGENTRRNDMYYFLKGALVIMISITAICYHIALAPIGFNMTSLQETVTNKKIASSLLHTYSPILVIMDYFLFDKKGRFKNYYPFLWLIYPLNYVGYVYLYASQGGEFYGVGGSKRFAYFFLDYTKQGVEGVIIWIIVISILILLLSYGLVLLDKKLLKRKRAKRKTH